MERFKKVIDEFNLDESKIINIYPYGSVNYGTFSKDSDEDFIIVYEQEKEHIPETLTSKDGNLNLFMYNIEGFKRAVVEYNFDAIECIFLPSETCYITKNIPYIHNKEKLRRSISGICSNSWVKCKKKLQQNDRYVGLKSTFHSLRIADYGIQIALHERILDFKVPFNDIGFVTYSDLWDDIKVSIDWNDIELKYKQLANNLRTKIRIVAPIDKDKRRTKKD